MPYEQHYVPAPKDMTLPVHDGDERHPPFGYYIMLSFSVLTAYHLLTHDSAYYCRHCGGWVNGHTNDYQVNTLGVLSGRQGTEYFCRRCGEQIAFIGKMA